MGDRDGCDGNFVLWYIRGPYHWPVQPDPHLVRLYDLGPLAGDYRSPPAQHSKASREHAQSILLGIGRGGVVHLLTRAPDEHSLLCRRADGWVHSGRHPDRLNAVAVRLC